MKVEFKQSIAGVNWSAKPGDKSDIDETEACQLCAAGIATPVNDADVSKVEKFVKERDAKAEKAATAAKKITGKN